MRDLEGLAKSHFIGKDDVSLGCPLEDEKVQAFELIVVKVALDVAWLLFELLKTNEQLSSKARIILNAYAKLVFGLIDTVAVGDAFAPDFELAKLVLKASKVLKTLMRPVTKQEGMFTLMSS